MVFLAIPAIFFKNSKISKFQLFGPIFRKMALDKPKWPLEIPGMGQMASFRMGFDQITYKNVLEKVYRKSDNLCVQAVLKICFGSVASTNTLAKY